MSVEVWHRLHEAGYFVNHPHYQDRFLDGGPLRDEIRDAVGLRAEDIAVDIGCGYGRAAVPLGAFVAKVIGIDLHPAPIAYAQEAAEKLGMANETFLVNDGQTIPLPDESVTLVYSFSTFQHMPRSYVAGYLREIGRVLVPGGRAYLQFMFGVGNEDFDPTNFREQSVDWCEDGLSPLLDALPFRWSMLRKPLGDPKSLAVHISKRMPMEHGLEMDAARERWNACHVDGGIGPLTGSDPRLVLQYHALDKVQFRGLNVLDIGIGKGGMAHHLSELGATVDSMDIADEAEKTVHDCIRRFYHADCPSLPECEYDFAISHLVAQHQWDRQLKEQIRDVFDALKPGGIFSLHLAGFVDPVRNNYDVEGIPVGLDGSMGRTRERSLAIIWEALGSGYTVKEVGKQMDWPHYQSYWYFFHIRKES
jgi:SAM-dependent methyltransferase